MGQAQRKTTPETQNQSDRREMARYDTSIKVDIRFMPDGAPISGSAIEIGPNGIRVVTALPLVEATYLHITFKSASNNTHCEGRVVWTQHSEDEVQYESGVDIQKWGGRNSRPPGRPASSAPAQTQKRPPEKTPVTPANLYTKFTIL